MKYRELTAHSGSSRFGDIELYSVGEKMTVRLKLKSVDLRMFCDNLTITPKTTKTFKVYVKSRLFRKVGDE